MGAMWSWRRLRVASRTPPPYDGPDEARGPSSRGEVPEAFGAVVISDDAKQLI